MEFLQGAITLENGTNKVVGNYYTENEDDTSGLVLDTDGELITDGGNGNVATPSRDIGGEDTPSNCLADTYTVGGYTFTTTSQTTHNSNTIPTPTKTENLTNGTRIYSQDFVCDNGTFKITGSETLNVNCTGGYSGNDCNTLPTTPPPSSNNALTCTSHTVSYSGDEINILVNGIYTKKNLQILCICLFDSHPSSLSLERRNKANSLSILSLGKNEFAFEEMNQMGILVIPNLY